MLLELLKFLFIQLLILVVAMIEQVVGLPLLSLTLFLIFSTSFSSMGSMLLLVLSSLLVATVFSQSWLLVFSVFALGMITFRTKYFISRGVLLPRILLITLLAVVIGASHQPTITTSFVLHSLVSFVLSSLVILRFVKYSSRPTDVSRIWLSSRR